MHVLDLMMMTRCRRGPAVLGGVILGDLTWGDRIEAESLMRSIQKGNRARL